MREEIHALSMQTLTPAQWRAAASGRPSADGQAGDRQAASRCSGEVRVSGAKNAALPILCAALLTAEPLVLDQRAAAERRAHHALAARADGRARATARRRRADASTRRDIDWPLAPYELVKTMRASILALGPLLARCGEARVSLPGGCAIGLRPVDQHIKGLQAMGAEIDLEHGYIDAKAKRLTGARIVFDMVTVTGTENLMMAATLADGTTVLENAAREPEVVDLADCLNAMGARITGAGTDRIVDRGRVARCTARRTRSCPIASRPGPSSPRPRRPAATSRSPARAPTRSTPCSTSCAKRASRDRSTASDDPRSAQRQAQVGQRCAPRPIRDFPTDMQAQFMALRRVADGTAVITETIFENRMMHVQELQRLGADIEVEGNTAIVRGVAEADRRRT